LCSLNGEPVLGGTFEFYINGSSIDVIIRGTLLTISQFGACSGSCNGGPQVSCEDDNGQSYTGTCQKCCCLSCGVTVHLTSCCGG
jgi:hypothetical protein